MITQFLLESKVFTSSFFAYEPSLFGVGVENIEGIEAKIKSLEKWRITSQPPVDHHGLLGMSE